MIASSSGSRAGHGDRFRRRTSSSSVSDREAMLSWTDVSLEQFLPRQPRFTPHRRQIYQQLFGKQPMVDSGSTFSFMRSSNWGRLRDALVSYCEKVQTPLQAQTAAAMAVGVDFAAWPEEEGILQAAKPGTAKRHLAAINSLKMRQHA